MIRQLIKQKEIRLLIVLIGISVILIILDTSYNMKKIKNIVRTLLVVEEKIYTRVTSYLNGYGIRLSNLNELNIENKILKVENKMLKERIRDFIKKKEDWQQILEENERLRKIVNYKKRLPKKTIVAKVIGFDPGNFFKVITINKGKKEGISRNMEIVTFIEDKEELVGKVIETGEYTSQVLLLLDQNSKVGVYIERNGINAVLTGNNRNYKLDYVDRDIDVQIGDKVVTSGKGGIFSKGVLVGKVSKITKERSELFYDIEVVPTLDQNKLEEVLVVVDENI
ncbi:MAG: rod shape-determining protein MreC [bacterium]|nr:rod shape-determining protein MreC [bacterium]